jgi:chorismate dehydratase
MLRVGMINFLNTIPLEMPPGTGGITFETVPGSPAKINRLLLSGEVDVGVISSAFFLAHRDELVRVGNLGIVSDGPAMSVGLFSNEEREALLRRGRRLAVYETPRSATSILLNRLILERFYGVAVVSAPDREHAEAILLIGDECLETFDAGTYGTFLDIGTEWKHHTGLPAVFAVLATSRESLAEKNSELTLYFSHLLEYHRRLYLDKDSLVAIARTRTHLPEKTLYEYFRSLSYIIGRREEESLSLFGRYIDELQARSPEEGDAVRRVLGSLS